MPGSCHGDAVSGRPRCLCDPAPHGVVWIRKRLDGSAELLGGTILFVILTGLVFFAWGEIYSLFPSTCADTFGSKYAAANAGLLYTAKGTASLLVPLSSLLTAMTGNWHAVFITASIMNAIAALMAWFVLRPMRRTQIESARIDVAAEPAV